MRGVVASGVVGAVVVVGHATVVSIVEVDELDVGFVGDVDVAAAVDDWKVNDVEVDDVVGIVVGCKVVGAAAVDDTVVVSV